MKARKNGLLRLVLAVVLLANAAAVAWLIWRDVKKPDVEVLAEAGNVSAVRVRLADDRYGYSLMLHNLDAKSDAEAAPAGAADGGDSGGAVAGLPPGSGVEIHSLADSEGHRAGQVNIIAQVLQADEAIDASPGSMKTGQCRLHFAFDSRGREGATAHGTTTALSGTYFEKADLAADARWQGNRMILWRYQTADGHGGKFRYEVFLQRQPKK